MCAKTCLDMQAGGAYRSIMAPKTYTLTGVAQYLGIPRRSLYNMLNDGRFAVPSIPGSKPRRWNVEDLDAWRRVQSDAAARMCA